MTDYKTMLASALDSGKSIEDIMKEISAAANEIQVEKAAATKYDNYNKPLDIEGAVFSRHLGTSAKITEDDMAIVFAHYLCQNVPGYAGYCAKNGEDLIKSAHQQLNNAVWMADIKLKTDGKSDEKKSKAMIEGAIDRIADAFIEAMAEEQLPPFPVKPVMGSSDNQKIAEFFKRQGL